MSEVCVEQNQPLESSFLPEVPECEDPAILVVME